MLISIYFDIAYIRCLDVDCFPAVLFSFPRYILSFAPPSGCRGMVKGKGKCFPILDTERWARSWSRCTGSHPPGGRLPLLSTRPAVTSPTAEHHRRLPVPSYTAWWQRHIGVNSLPKVVTQRCLEQDLNPRPTDRKSNALPVALPRHRRGMTFGLYDIFNTVIMFLGAPVVWILLHAWVRVRAVLTIMRH